MTPLGHDQPDLLPDILFSDIVIEVLRAFADHARTETPSTLAAAITVLARLWRLHPRTPRHQDSVAHRRHPTGMDIGYRRTWPQPS